MSSYPNGFSDGLVLKEVPVELGHSGKVFYVNNSSVLAPGGISGSDGNPGSFKKPFSTLEYAISKCVANRGDIIYVMPGHVETISAADAIDFDVAGISVIGLGKGSKMPRLDYTNAAGEVAIGADNILLQNLNFHANVTDVLIGVDIEDGVDYAVIKDCLFDVEAEATDEFAICIRLTNDNTRCKIINNVFNMGLGGAVSAIKLDADTAYTLIKGNAILGDYSTACINGDTTLSTNVLIEDNLLVQGIGGNIGTEPGIELLTGTTGIIRRNDIVCNLATKAASVVADTCFLFENYYNEDVSGGATGGIIGTASADD